MSDFVKKSPRKLGFLKGSVPDSFFEPMTKEELADWYDGPIFPINPLPSSVTNDVENQSPNSKKS